MRRSLTRFDGCIVFAVGHSTRAQEELVELLFAHGVATLVDVRTVPRSRKNPQFNRGVLEVLMPRVGIGYRHLALLGGLRKTIGAASKNQAWRNLSFRGYADYMQTPAFEEGLAELRALCFEGPPAVMCAEGMRWRCHRSLLADAIVARGGEVQHIVSWRRAVEHAVTPFARMRAGRVTYPSRTRSASVR
jgi:uncharacterized protein (DUF488 family)